MRILLKQLDYSLSISLKVIVDTAAFQGLVKPHADLVEWKLMNVNPNTQYDVKETKREYTVYDR